MKHFSLSRIYVMVCLTIFTIISSATPNISFSLSGKKATRTFDAKALRVLDGANDFFESNWAADTIKLTEVASYMRQNEHFTGKYDCDCRGYNYIGAFKGHQLSENRKMLITSTLKLHDANIQICVMDIYDRSSALSFLNGDVFLNWKTIQKLTDAEFVALMSHEIGHRYAHRIMSNDHEEEIFADYVAAWTLRGLGLDTNASATLFNRLPGKKGGPTHPSHKERQARLAKLTEGWELSASIFATNQ